MNENIFKKLLPFVQKYKHLIDLNNFSELYSKFIIEGTYPISILTELLLKADIDIFVDPGLIKIPDGCFTDIDITSINTRDYIVEIDYNAFLGCTKLENITLSKNLKTIGCKAFQFCRNLEEINLPDSIKDISDLAFSSCSKLKKS